jgi:Kef-type K+ transport system membrane component KefB
VGIGQISFSGLLLVMAIAFAAPLLLGLAPWLRVPAVVVEIVAGIAVGPSGLGWVHVDAAIGVLSMLGLAFLLFLAGQEIDVDRLRGRPLALAGGGFALSCALALAVGLAAAGAGMASSPLLVGIVLLATSLGLVVPVLADAGQAGTPFGQLVIAGATLADFGAVILLSLLFSREAGSPAVRGVLLAAFAVTVAAVGVVVLRAERLPWLSMALARLQDTTAEIRVRGALLLLVALAAVAARFGVELLLAAFMAGVVLRLVDRDERMTHPQLQGKLRAVGYGFLIPVFFVASGIQFDLRSLAAPSSLAAVPVFLVALLAVRGLPAALYLPALGARRAAAAALLQATSLPFIVAATQLGVALGALGPATAAALVAAGLVSVVAFPAAALALVRPAAVAGEAAATSTT